MPSWGEHPTPASFGARRTALCRTLCHRKKKRASALSEIGARANFLLARLASLHSGIVVASRSALSGPAKLTFAPTAELQPMTSRARGGGTFSWRVRMKGDKDSCLLASIMYRLQHLPLTNTTTPLSPPRDMGEVTSARQRRRTPMIKNNKNRTPKRTVAMVQAGGSPQYYAPTQSAAQRTRSGGVGGRPGGHLRNITVAGSSARLRAF